MAVSQRNLCHTEFLKNDVSEDMLFLLGEEFTANDGNIFEFFP